MTEIRKDYTDRLLALMRSATVTTYSQLYQLTGLSEKAFRRLRRGQLEYMQVGTLQKVAAVLKVSVTDLILAFSEPGMPAPSQSEPSQSELSQSELSQSELSQSELSQPQLGMSAAIGSASSAVIDLQQECERLRQQLQQQQKSLLQDFQRSSLQTLEPWLLQWSAAVYLARQNPQAPAVKLLPLVQPVENLVMSWGVMPIGAVGESVPFDPQVHQVIQGQVNPGERVQVRYVGYRHGDRLLCRAKVIG
jgi:molecular chaperone GrpE (heat shock protein)/DNA-binding Xre family transcriptional regulator